MNDKNKGKMHNSMYHVISSVYTKNQLNIRHTQFCIDAQVLFWECSRVPPLPLQKVTSIKNLVYILSCVYSCPCTHIYIYMREGLCYCFIQMEKCVTLFCILALAHSTTRYIFEFSSWWPFVFIPCLPITNHDAIYIFISMSYNFLNSQRLYHWVKEYNM